MIAILRKYAIIIYILVSFLILSSCWDYNDLDRIALVSGVGIDLDETGETIVTFQIMKPISTASKSSSYGDEEPIVFEEKGKTLFDALKNASAHASRELIFSHNRVIILGKEAAKDNPRGYLDVLSRGPDGSTFDYLLVADDKASEILYGKGNIDKISSLDLGHLVDNYKLSGFVVPIQVNDFSEVSLSSTQSPVAPIVKLDEKNAIYLSETAIFNKNRLIGSLTEDETKGFLWVTNKLKVGLITVEDKATNTLISFEILDINTEIRPKLHGNNKVVIELTVKANTKLSAKIKSNNDITMKDLEKLQELELANIIDLSLKKATFYKTDIFGFGEYIYANYPGLWKDINDSWEDVFSTIQYQINTEVIVKNHGLLKDEFKEK